MSEFDIIRTWKDPEYWESLTEEQRSQLPENPAGMIELSDEEMKQVNGGGAFSICWGRTRGCFLKPEKVEVGLKDGKWTATVGFSLK